MSVLTVSLKKARNKIAGKKPCYKCGEERNKHGYCSNSQCVLHVGFFENSEGKIRINGNDVLPLLVTHVFNEEDKRVNPNCCSICCGVLNEHGDCHNSVCRDTFKF